MDLLLHFKVNEGDENNINIQEYMLYGDVETKSEKCLVDEGDEVVLTEFPVPEFKNCTLMKKGDEGFYEYLLIYNRVVDKMKVVYPFYESVIIKKPKKVNV